MSKPIIFYLLPCLAIAGCGDTIRPIQKSRSPDGDVVAEYVEVLYGGAAGGITYCVNLSFGGRKEDCALALVHVERGKLTWAGRRLTFTYCGGTLTNNESGVRQAEGMAPFRLRVREHCN